MIGDGDKFVGGFIVQIGIKRRQIHDDKHNLHGGIAQKSPGQL